MNKDIEKMLKYQEVDMQLYLLDKKLKNAEDTKTWMDASARRKEFKDEYVTLDRDIESEMTSVNKAIEDFNNLMAEANDIENSITDKNSIDVIDFFLKKIEDILKKIKDLEVIGADSKKALEKMNETADNDLKQIVKLSQIIAKYKPIVEKMTLETKAEAKQIKAKLDAIVEKEKIDKESAVFKVYKKKSMHKMPVFVELNEKSCGGCGVEVPNSVKDAAEKLGYAECPNCGRIVYQK